MRVLIFSKYSRDAASSRYRLLQYLPFLDEAKIEYDINILLNDEYINSLNKNGFSFRLFFIIVFSYFRRLKDILRSKNYDLLIIQYEVFPYFPSWAEFLLSKFGIPYLVDYDDAIFHNYDKNKNLLVQFFYNNKIRRVIKYASAVVVGSHYLFEYASKFNFSVSLVPTVVNLTRYNSTTGISNSNFTVGWIGSSSTSKYLLPYIDLFRKLSIQGIEFSFIGFYEGYKHMFNGINVTWHNWSECSEISVIKSFSVGIMPLDDTPWTKGKCGFKLIQYMACGLPVIASPVGENNYIVRHGENGFLARDPNDWYKYILMLKENKVNSVELGKNGQEIVKNIYSLENTGKKIVEIITHIK